MSSISFLIINSNMSSGIRWIPARERAAGIGFYKHLKMLLFLPNVCISRAGDANRLDCLLSCAVFRVIAFWPGFGLETLMQDTWTPKVGPVWGFLFPGNTCTPVSSFLFSVAMWWDWRQLLWAPFCEREKQLSLRHSWLIQLLHPNWSLLHILQLWMVVCLPALLRRAL